MTNNVKLYPAILVFSPRYPRGRVSCCLTAAKKNTPSSSSSWSFAAPWSSCWWSCWWWSIFSWWWWAWLDRQHEWFCSITSYTKDCIIRLFKGSVKSDCVGSVWSKMWPNPRQPSGLLEAPQKSLFTNGQQTCWITLQGLQWRDRAANKGEN